MTNKNQPPTSPTTEQQDITHQHQSYSYQPAFLDQAFLLREELRPVRLQLELLKPEIIQNDLDVTSTIIVIGSARIPEPKIAREKLAQAEKALAADKTNHQLIINVNKARSHVDKSHYYDKARQFSQLVSRYGDHDDKQRLYIVTGGGPSFMEAANRGAHDEGVKSIALSVELPFESAPNPYVTPELTFKFHYFAIRKMHFLIRAKALVAFPGGFGTLDELFETLTLIQTQKIKPLPILLFGKKFWDNIINFQGLVDEGTINAHDLDCIHYVETAEDAWEIIAQYYDYR